MVERWSRAPRLFPVARRREFVEPAKSIPRSPLGHREEWIAACQAGRPEDAKAGFAYSGPFTKALLVGNLATRLQKRVEWDGEGMRVRNAAEAEGLVRNGHRKGFEI